MDPVSWSSANVVEGEQGLEGNVSKSITRLERALTSGVDGEYLVLGSEGRGLVGAGRGNACSVPRDNESGLIAVSSWEAGSLGVFSTDSASVEEVAQGVRALGRFGSASLTGAFIKPSDDFPGSSGTLGSLSNGPIRGLGTGDVGDDVVFSIIWYRGIDEFLQGPLLDVRGGAISGKSFKVGDKGVTLRTEDCSDWFRFWISRDDLGSDSVLFPPTDVLIVPCETGATRAHNSAELDGRWICSPIDVFLYEWLVESNEEVGRAIV